MKNNDPIFEENGVPQVIDKTEVHRDNFDPKRAEHFVKTYNDSSESYKQHIKPIKRRKK